MLERKGKKLNVVKEDKANIFIKNDVLVNTLK